MIPEYSKRFCPLLSVAMIRPKEIKEPSMLVASVDAPAPNQNSADLDLVPCQGPLCGFWINTANEHGVISDGACSLTLIPIAIGQVTEVIKLKSTEDK